MSKPIIIGTRGSKLALWQAYFTKSELEKLGHEVELLIIKTQGDKIQHLSFDKLEGKGFFTKEIEDFLLDGTIDIAVHSHKDLETNQPDGLVVAAVSKRANPSDLLVIKKENYDSTMPLGVKQNAIIGTSSARRKNQITDFRPDITLADIRGNVPTRIAKLTEQGFDAIMLAKAGVDRLEINLDAFEVIVLNPTEFIPAPAQGVLGWQIRANDTRMAKVIAPLNCKETKARIDIERKVLNLFDGGCQLPLGAYVESTKDGFDLHVSMSENWENSPKKLKLSGTDISLAQQAVDQLKKKDGKSL